MNKKRRVSAVIPNYDGQNLLKKFLPNVFKCLRNGDEVVVVDDASDDNSVSFLIKKYQLKPVIKYSKKVRYPELKSFTYRLYQAKVSIEKNKKINLLVVSLQKNVRFAMAANIGVILTSTPYILLLNNDVKPTKSVVDKLLTNFDDKSVFAVGCLEYEKNKKGEKSGKNELWFEKGLFRHSKAEDMNSGETAWVSGGSGMFNRKMWLSLGGFDKLFYPAYWEDIDLSFRAKKQGYKVLFDQEAVVYHVHETTNSDVFGQTKIESMSWANARKFVLKNGTWWQKVLYYLYKPYWDQKIKRSMRQKVVA
jgi:GT2 family glycosyltransferase